MRHQRSIWNGLWSDIELIFMRYGHSPMGIGGIIIEVNRVPSEQVKLQNSRCNI